MSMRNSKPTRLQLCRTIGCLILLGLVGCSQPATVCTTPTLSESATVGLRPIGPQKIELVKHTNDETTTIATFTGESRTTWFAAQINDDEAVYGWVDADKTDTDMHPTWITADNRTPIEPTLCQIGTDSYSIIIATDDVILKTESEQTLLKMPRTGGITGHISMLEEPTSNQR